MLVHVCVCVCQRNVDWTSNTLDRAACPVASLHHHHLYPKWLSFSFSISITSNSEYVKHADWTMQTQMRAIFYWNVKHTTAYWISVFRWKVKCKTHATAQQYNAQPVDFGSMKYWTMREKKKGERWSIQGNNFISPWYFYSLRYFDCSIRCYSSFVCIWPDWKEKKYYWYIDKVRAS